MSIKTITPGENVLTNTVRQAAVRIGLSERSIWSAISQRRLSSVRIGTRVLIPEDALRSFLGLREPHGCE
jgi:excisionase family DNA binding protein